MTPTRKKREVWVIVTRTGRPVEIGGSGVVPAYASKPKTWMSYSAALYIPAPTKKKPKRRAK